MLKTFFNRAARPSYLPEKPVILVSTVGDDDHRGDSHAYIGIGRIVAEKLGGEYRHINDNTIDTLYPDLAGREHALHQYFEDHGVPDILFSRFYHSPELWYPVYRDRQAMTYDGKQPYIITAMNEVLTHSRSAPKINCDYMLSHHLTPALLRAEGEKLRQTYPQITSPLITVMMADNTTYNLASCLISRIKNMPEATVFVCSGRRTDSEYFDEVRQSLHYEIGAARVQNKIRILGYDFKKESKKDTLNPYMGLINESDHIIVCGHSGSIISETLSAQRSIHLFPADHNFNDSRTMIRNGLATAFNQNDKTSALETHSICVANPTERTADEIIRKYKKKCRNDLGVLRGALAYVMEG